MPYTFRVIFSGPCAYVPNRVEGDSRVAKSWSVILPNLSKRWPVKADGEATDEKTADGISVDPHLAVLQFDETAFVVEEGGLGDGNNRRRSPDVRLGLRRSDESYAESSLYLLDGWRVHFEIPDAPELGLANAEVGDDLLGDKDRILRLPEEQRRSLVWLPALSWLRPGVEHFGRADRTYFGTDAYPKKGTVAGHVLLTHGELATAEIDSVVPVNQPREATIWEFRPRDNEGYGGRCQAVARRVMLEATWLEKPVTVVLSPSAKRQFRLKLKAARSTGVVEIEIKNRELEEIFLPGGSENDLEVDLDEDFRYLYSHIKGYDPLAKDYLLPHRVKGGGAGNNSATCGGKQGSGFSRELAYAVCQW